MVPLLWPGCTIVCLASGPSLTPADVEYVRGKAHVIAVNDTFTLAPWADVLYGQDAKWWKHHRGVPSFQGLKFACDSRAMHAPSLPDVQLLKNMGQTGLESDRAGIRTGQNSGYGATNVAVHLGAARILLLGYDMQVVNGHTHFFGDHPVGLQVRSPFADFLRYFQTLVEPMKALGIDVVNCSRQSALTCFPRQPIEQAIPC